MKRLLFILLFSFTSVITAQSQFQDFINYVNSLGDPAAKQAAVDSFMTYARTVGIPFLEDSTANFLYQGNESTVTVAGDFNEWDMAAWPMIKLFQTDLWYRSEIFELDARLDYKFVLNGSAWILDPENPDVCQGGYGPNSELSMPLYVQPWEIQYNAGIQHGTLVTKSIYSVNVGTNYQLYIYLPPGYDTLSSESYPAVYFQDGMEYITLGRAVNVLDNLLDSAKIRPVIGIFVTPNNRNEEYAGSLRNQYTLFFVDELVPYIDANYKTKVGAKNRLVIGDSFGGNISALISYNHPEVFGLCGLHSAAFWPNNYEAYNLIINGPVEDIEWSSIWGTYESLYPNMRSFRDYLISAGYELDWLERPEGHSWGLWRASTDRILKYFYPPAPIYVEQEKNISPDNIILYQNYPNPFNPSTKITWYLKQSGRVTLKVFDVLGREAAVVLDEYRSSGMNEAVFSMSDLSSGVYFYRIEAGEYSAIRKMVILR